MQVIIRFSVLKYIESHVNLDNTDGLNKTMIELLKPYEAFGKKGFSLRELGKLITNYFDHRTQKIRQQKTKSFF